MSQIIWTAPQMHWANRGLVVRQRRSVRGRATVWSEAFVADGSGVVLPTAGGYQRRDVSGTHFVDRNTGFFRRRGEEATVSQATTETVSGTIIDIDLRRHHLLDEDDWPSAPHLIDPHLDLSHRLLLREIRRASEPWVVELRVLDLVQSAVRRHTPTVAGGGRGRVDLHRLVAELSDILLEPSSSITLVELARHAGYSPTHLSATFRKATGVTLTQYRQQVRVRRVLDRLEDGVENLAELAIETGFADHSHMTRAVVAQLGRPPSRLRELLSRTGANPA